MLELSSAPPYDSSLHGSKGIAPGTFRSGDLATRIAVGWSGAIKRYTDFGEARCKWLPAEPQEGSFDVAVAISQDSALAVQAFEREHIEDFERAWDTSFGLVADMLRTCPPGSPQKTVVVLVNRLLDAGAGYVIPAHPQNLDEWGPRICDVYLALCKHSYRRDEQGQHSPSGYQFTAIADSIHVSFVFGPRRPSDAYVKPGEISPVFTAASYEEYGQGPAAGPVATAGPGLPAGTAVTWSEAASDRFENWPVGLGPQEQALHASPSADTDQWITDMGTINWRLTSGEAAVVAQDGEYTWVKISVRDTADDGEISWRSAAAKKLDPPGGIAYARLRSRLLTPRT